MKPSFRIMWLLVCCVMFVGCKDDGNKTTNTPSNAIQTSSGHAASAVHIFPNPASGNSQLPRLFSDDNTLYFSWVTTNDSVNQLLYSTTSGSNWQEPKLITQGNDWFTNWADFPAIAANNESILTSHLQKSANGTYTYDVILNLLPKDLPSPDQQQTTKSRENSKENFILHNDETKSEHGFVSMLPYQENSFFVTWLDGRNTVGNTHGSHDEHGLGGAMTLRAAVIPATGEVAQRTELDARVCDCCQTSAAMTLNGPIVAYRDRSEAEIRDISVVRFVAGSWTQPMTIGDDNWKIAGCPVNGPSIDASEEQVVVAWFTASQGEGDVNVSFSSNAGATFGPAFRIDSGSATGRVDVVLLDNNEAAVLWMQPKGEEEMLYIVKINAKGNIGKPVVISKMTSDRASGFPQLERLGDTLFIAWTDAYKEITTIKTATIALNDL